MGRVNTKRIDGRLDTSFKLCDHCNIMLPGRNFKRGKKITTCKECFDAPGFVYIAHNPAWPKVYKVGITENPEKRLQKYNGAVPFNDTEFIYIKPSAFYKEIEREIMDKFSYNRIYRKYQTEWLNNINDVSELIDSIGYFHYEIKATKELEIID